MINFLDHDITPYNALHQLTQSYINKTMPIVTIDILRGRTLAQKRALVASVSKAIQQSIAAKPEAIHIKINEMDRENYAINDTLVIDIKKDE
jgi:4-oxalocrotonate tautomerase